MNNNSFLSEKTINLKTIEPEYINFVENFKNPSDLQLEYNTFLRKFIKKTGFFLNNFFDLIKAVYLIIIIGCFMRFTYPLDYSHFGKLSYLTGIPILRNFQLLPPILLQVAIIIMAFALYNNKRIYEKYTKTKYFQKLNFLNIFSFIVKIICFYFIYIFLILKIKEVYFIKFSGHILANLFCNSLILSVKNISQHFIKQGISQRNFTILMNICYFFIWHNLYVLVFTAWIYHSIFECLMSLIIGSFYILVIDFMNFDQIFLILFCPKFYNPKKSKYFIN
jgi:hypothetical protein